MSCFNIVTLCVQGEPHPKCPEVMHVATNAMYLSLKSTAAVKLQLARVNKERKRASNYINWKLLSTHII